MHRSPSAAQSTSSLPRRGFLAAVVGSVMLGATACASTASASSSTATASDAATSTAGATSGSGATPSLASLVSQVKSKFKQASYADAATGKSLPYNVFLPDGYDASKTYPLVLYIADSSLVGQDVTAPLSQYGALIWASDLEQGKH